MTKKSQSNVAAVSTAQTQDTQTMRVIWTDKMVEDYLDACISEIYAGNRPGTHFNKTGWKNVVNKFSEKTGKRYYYKQLKNKWDNLKRDWNIWMRLVGKETDLKWDPVKKTIDATNAWWEKKLQEIPEAAKFRTTGLAHVVKVEMLFTDITATREGPWVTSSILVPNDIGTTNGVGVRCDEGNDAMLEGLGDLDDESNLSAHECSMCDRKRKKEVQIVSQHLGRMCDILESRSTMPFKRPDKRGCSIEEVMDVVRGIAEIENDIDILMIASEVLLTRSHREMFVALKEPKFQIEFLKRMRNVKINH